MNEPRTLLRALVALNAALYIGYLIWVMAAVLAGDDPWVSLTAGWLFGLGFFLAGVPIPLAAIGLAAPLALFDLAAAAYFMVGRHPIGMVFAALYVLAFGIGATLQAIVAIDWAKRRSHRRVASSRSLREVDELATASGTTTVSRSRRAIFGTWGPRLAQAIGVLAVLGVLAFAGTTLLVTWAFSDKVQPEFLEELRADPMATYSDAGLDLISEGEVEAADSWTGFRSAEIQRRFTIGEQVDPGTALERAIAAAMDGGWSRGRTFTDNAAQLVKDRLSLRILVSEGDGDPTLLLTLRNP